MLNLLAIDDSIRARLAERVPALIRIVPLAHEEELDKQSDLSNVAYTLLRGGHFTPPRGWGDEQKGSADVLVWIKARSVAHAPAAAARDESAGAYALMEQVVAALNGFVPVQDTALSIAEFGVVKMRSAYEVIVALKFNLVLAVPFTALNNAALTSI